MEYIKGELQIITNNLIKKRLEREFYNLLSNDIIYPESVSVKLAIKPYHENYIYSVCFYTLNNNYFEFFLNINYPFHPPKLNLNFKPYSYLYYLKPESSEFNIKLFKYKNIRCLCCKTILCGNNWSPGYTMNNVINEINTFKNICCDISKIVMIDVIKRKYLIDDIDIIGWIF